jgi:hypothetical protein
LSQFWIPALSTKLNWVLSIAVGSWPGNDVGLQGMGVVPGTPAMNAGFGRAQSTVLVAGS